MGEHLLDFGVKINLIIHALKNKRGKIQTHMIQMENI